LLSFICDRPNGDFVPGEEAVEPAKGHHKDDLAIGVELKKESFRGTFKLPPSCCFTLYAAFRKGCSQRFRPTTTTWTVTTLGRFYELKGKPPSRQKKAFTTEFKLGALAWWDWRFRWQRTTS